MGGGVLSVVYPMAHVSSVGGVKVDSAYLSSIWNEEIA